MEELHNREIVGLVKNTGDGYILINHLGLPLPDNIVRNVVAQGISDEEYVFNTSSAVKEINSSQSKQEYKKKTTSGHIYAVIAGNTIKIGKSKSLQTRLRMYEKAFPNYKLIGFFSSNDITEDEIKTLSRFGGTAGTNEWLPFSTSLEEDVSKYFKTRLGL